MAWARRKGSQEHTPNFLEDALVEVFFHILDHALPLWEGKERKKAENKKSPSDVHLTKEETKERNAEPCELRSEVC